VDATTVDRVKIGRREVLVKREDLCCPDGPGFSKMRGVMAHLSGRPEPVFGVVDTFHSKGGWAVARCAKALGKKAVVYYPHYKAEEVPTPKRSQLAAQKLGAELRPLPAGRAFLMLHRVRADMGPLGGYTVLNGLKFRESVEETAAEVRRTPEAMEVDNIVIAVSSATIAAGVLKGLAERLRPVRAYLHQGYSRSVGPMLSYVGEMVGKGWSRYADGELIRGDSTIEVIDEGYSYSDVARPGASPPFPCNPFYDLKTWRWLEQVRSAIIGSVMFWNIGD